jgi:hypothetical protein
MCCCPLANCAPAGQPKAEVVEAVHEKLRTVAAALSAGQLPLSAFVITKQLTKRPEDYPDAKGQPHVQVCARYGVGQGAGSAATLCGFSGGSTWLRQVHLVRVSSQRRCHVLV